MGHLIDGDAHTFAPGLSGALRPNRSPIAAMRCRSWRFALDDDARRRRSLTPEPCSCCRRAKVSRQLLRWNTQHGKRHARTFRCACEDEHRIVERNFGGECGFQVDATGDRAAAPAPLAVLTNGTGGAVSAARLDRSMVARPDGAGDCLTFAPGGVDSAMTSATGARHRIRAAARRPAVASRQSRYRDRASRQPSRPAPGPFVFGSMASARWISAACAAELSPLRHGQCVRIIGEQAGFIGIRESARAYASPIRRSVRAPGRNAPAAPPVGIIRILLEALARLSTIAAICRSIFVAVPLRLPWRRSRRPITERW